LNAKRTGRPTLGNYLEERERRQPEPEGRVKAMDRRQPNRTEHDRLEGEKLKTGRPA